MTWKVFLNVRSFWPFAVFLLVSDHQSCGVEVITMSAHVPRKYLPRGKTSCHVCGLSVWSYHLHRHLRQAHFLGSRPPAENFMSPHPNDPTNLNRDTRHASQSTTLSWHTSQLSSSSSTFSSSEDDNGIWDASNLSWTLHRTVGGCLQPKRSRKVLIVSKQEIDYCWDWSVGVLACHFIWRRPFASNNERNVGIRAESWRYYYQYKAHRTHLMSGLSGNDQTAFSCPQLMFLQISSYVCVCVWNGTHTHTKTSSNACAVGKGRRRDEQQVVSLSYPFPYPQPRHMSAL